MARIRTIKPGFFTSLSVGALPVATRLTWIGLWIYVDDAGRGVDNARLIKAAVWPLDDDHTAQSVEEDMGVLAAAGMIQRYERDGQRYFQVTNWSAHQYIQKPQKSTLPPPRNESDSHKERGPNPPGPVDGTLPERYRNVHERSGRTTGTLPESEPTEAQSQAEPTTPSRETAGQRLSEGNSGSFPVALPERSGSVPEKVWWGKEGKGIKPSSSSAVNRESAAPDVVEEEEEEQQKTENRSHPAVVRDAARLVAERRLAKRQGEPVTDPGRWLARVAERVLADEGERMAQLADDGLGPSEIAQAIVGAHDPPSPQPPPFVATPDEPRAPAEVVHARLGEARRAVGR